MTRFPAKSSLISYLSQELIDEVIDTVFYSEDEWILQWKNLSNCSLVCKPFRARAQKHLFSHITLLENIAEDNNNTKIPSLLEILDKHPSIASHIHGLRLEIYESRSTWIYDKPEMKRIMQHITHYPTLKKLELTGNRLLQVIYSPPHLIDQFTRPFIEPNITCLHLKLLKNLPPQLVSACRHLKELSLIFVYFSDNEDGKLPDSRPSIERLKYSADRSVSRVCSELHLDFSNLRHFTIITDELEDLVPEQGIISGSQGALEELRIERHVYQRAHLTPTPIDLSNQPRIHTLRQVAFFNGPDSNSLLDTCFTLSTIPTGNKSLKALDLILQVGVKDFVPSQTLREVILNADWETFGSEILRVAGDRAFSLALRMRYHISRGIFGADRVTLDIIGSKCDEIFLQIFERRMKSLKIHPGIIVSYSMGAG